MRTIGTDATETHLDVEAFLQPLMGRPTRRTQFRHGTGIGNGNAHANLKK
jgi:hypothetical protein